MDWTYFSRFPLGATLSYNQERQHEFGPGNFALSLLNEPSLSREDHCMYNNPVTGLPLAGSCGPQLGGNFGRGYGLPQGYGLGYGPNYGYGTGYYGNGYGYGNGGARLGPQWGFGRTRGALGPALDGFTAGLLS